MKPKSRIWMAITGILMVILGVVCICNPTALFASVSVLIGIMILVSGISTFLSWMRIKDVLPAGNLLISAVLQVILGVVFISHTLLIEAVMSVLFACWVFMEGIIMTIRSTEFKSQGAKSWPLLLVAGILAAAAGLYAIIHPIGTASTFIAFCIGAVIIILGLVDIIAVFGIRKIERSVQDEGIDEQ